MNNLTVNYSKLLKRIVLYFVVVLICVVIRVPRTSILWLIAAGARLWICVVAVNFRVV